MSSRTPVEKPEYNQEPIRGQCLCGDVAFEISRPLPHFYQCHCSLCRKLSGSASDTATFLNKEQLAWVQGEDCIRRYQTATGYRSEFCGNCGSTVPALMDNGCQYWIPAGLLTDTHDSRVVSHLFVDSKAHWDTICGDAEQHGEMPDMQTLNQKLHQ